MRKIFLLTTLILTMLTATAFAAENTETEKGVEYTSELYGFKIVCPAEPKVVVNPFPEPDKRGELLIFAVTPDGQDVAYGYMIQLDAFDTKAIPDFNKSKKNLKSATSSKVLSQSYAKILSWSLLFYTLPFFNRKLFLPILTFIN